MPLLIFPSASVVPLLESETTGAASDSSGKTRGSRHSRITSLYLCLALFEWVFTPLISFFLSFLHVTLFSITLPTSEHSPLLFFKLLISRPSHSCRLEPSPMLRAPHPHLHPSSLTCHRCHPFPPPAPGDTSRAFHPLPLLAWPSTGSDNLFHSSPDAYQHSLRALFFRTKATNNVLSSA